MITINTKQTLTDMKGGELKDNVGITFTVGGVLSNVMAGRVSNPSWGWMLGKKFATEDEVSLKAEEVVFIKKELENNSHQEYGYTAIVIGQVIEILEGEKLSTEKVDTKK